MARKPAKKRPAKKRSSALKVRKPPGKAREAKRAAAKAEEAKPEVPAAKRSGPAPKPAAVAFDATSTLPGGDQIQAEVNHALTKAMTDRLDLEITGTTVPSGDEFGFDEGGWMLVLENFAVDLKSLRPVYAYYQPFPIYAQETLDKEYDDIVTYLTDKVIAQFPDGVEKP